MTAAKLETAELMFEDDDRQALKFLIDNGTITGESMKTPQCALNAIRTTIKSKEDFWVFQDKLLSNVRQLPDKGILVLSMHISNVISQCKFPKAESQEMLKIMVLQHAVCTHNSRDWISHKTSPSSHTSPSLPNANCWNPGASNIKRLGKGTSWHYINHCSNLLSICHPCWCPKHLLPLQQVWLIPTNL